MDFELAAIATVAIVIRMAFPVLVGKWAESRGRSFLPWFLCGVVLGPLITAAIVYVLPAETRREAARIVDFGQPAPPRPD
jgi:hypothetical protein